MKNIIQGNYGTMYYVDDMAKSVDYYKTIFGLAPRFESAEWTEFAFTDGTGLCLHSTGEKKLPAQRGGILITKVSGLKSLVPELKKKGVEFYSDIIEVHPGAFAADFKDPSGNRVSLYEDTNSH